MINAQLRDRYRHTELQITIAKADWAAFTRIYEVELEKNAVDVYILYPYDINIHTSKVTARD